MEKLAGSSPHVYIGSLISLTSKGEIRYEGVLHTLDTENSTIVLEDVRSFGTEGRGKNILHLSASSKVYEYIIFRDTDIKDLSVLSFPGNFDKSINKDSEGNGHMQSVKDITENLKGESLEIALGWPVSPYSSCTQEFANWWQWLFPPASRINGIPPSVPLAFVPKDAHTEISHSSSSSSLQGNHGIAVMSPLTKFEQVPNVIPANVCNTQNSEVPHHLPADQGSASGKGFISGHLIFQPRTWPHGEKFQIKPLKVQPFLQQPLLPLPVSETEHLRLIRESMCSANLEHLRRPRFRSRGRVRGAMIRRGAPSRTHNEVSCSMQQFSEDFDFEAMNEHFNKKELWHDLDLNERQAMTGEQNDTSENLISTCSPSRKLLFVDDFYDLISSKDEDCKETRAQGWKQRQIDLETFGVSSRPGRGRRNGFHKGGGCTL